MSSVEIFVAIFCAVMGYLIVAHFIGPKDTRPGLGDANSAGPRSSGKNDQRAGAGKQEHPEASQQEQAPPWWDVLGVTLGASEEEIQRAYRSQIRKYHPDKVAHLADELRQLAEKRAKDINRAYREAMRVHGKTT